jgi:hypothetical protein
MPAKVSVRELGIKYFHPFVQAYHQSTQQSPEAISRPPLQNPLLQLSD